MAAHKARIDTLDGFRCIAILMVMLYHYYSRWTPPIASPSYYPYGSSLSAYFQYGNLGVNFFFIISGFVIFFTLEKSPAPGTFFLKRFIRLFPPILVCAFITWFAVNALDPGGNFKKLHSTTVLDFLPSITFIHPAIWTKLLHNDNIYYIDGAYWSLWVEIIFYIISGCIFFFNKEKFIRNWTILLICSLVVKIFCLPQLTALFPSYPFLGKISSVANWFLLYFNFFNFIIYFTLGILFYCLFVGKKPATFFTGTCVAFVIVEFCSYPTTAKRLGFLLMILVFLLFVYRPQFTAFLKSRIITRIGIISYTVYLVHQNVGVVLINRLCNYTQSPLLQKLVPLLVMMIMIAFAELSYRLYEKPVMKKLTALLVKKPVKSN